MKIKIFICEMPLVYDLNDIGTEFDSDMTEDEFAEGVSILKVPKRTLRNF